MRRRRSPIGYWLLAIASAISPPMNPEPDLLKNVSLFQFLDERERTDLAGQLQSVRFAAGETLFTFPRARS